MKKLIGLFALAFCLIAFLARGDEIYYPPPAKQCVSLVANDARWYPVFAQCGTFGGSAGVSAGAVTIAADAYCSPFVLPQAEHWDQLGATISTLGTSNFQIAVYADTIVSSLHVPGANLAATANIADTSTGTFSSGIGTGGVGISIPAGINWLCYQANDATVIFQNTGPSGLAVAGLIGASTAALAGSAANITALRTPNTFGTWASLAGNTFTEISGFALAATFRLATVP